VHIPPLPLFQEQPSVPLHPDFSSNELQSVGDGTGDESLGSAVGIAVGPELGLAVGSSVTAMGAGTGGGVVGVVPVKSGRH